MILFVLIFHTWVIKQLLTYSLSYTLGADVLIQEVKMDWKNTGFEVRGLDILNPYSFPRDRLADIPLAIISVDVDAVMHGRLHLKTVGFNLRELQVMNAPKQGLNVLALKPIQRAKEVEDLPPPHPAPPKSSRDRGPILSIGELIFSVGDIRYLDMRSGVTKQNLFRADIQAATYFDIRGADDMVVIVATEALKKMGFVLLNSQLQKIQSRYLATPANSQNFFSRAVSAVKEKLS